MPPDDVHRIPLPTPFQIGDVNAWLLRGSPLTLFDAGPLMEETEARLEQGLAAHGVAVEDLELIVLTHQHDDHVGLAGELQRRSGAELAGTAKLATFLSDVELSMDADDAYAVALMRRHGVTERTVETLGGISRAFRRFVASARVDRILDDGGELIAGGRAWRVHERPGHSPTDTVFASEGLLLAGDHLLERISSNPIAHAPVGVSDPAALAASPDRPRTLVTYVESLRATAAADGGELVLPGHGESFRGIAELVDKRASMHERRAEKILAALTHPRSAADIGRDLWRHVPVTQAFLVLSEVLGHLDLLEARGAGHGARARRRGALLARRRRLSMDATRGHWLKAIGHARGPLREGWLDERPELLRRTGFPRRPRILPGDRLVYYASVWRRVFAVVEVIAEPEPREHPRWPWTIAVEPLLVVPVLDAAPPVEAIGVAARSMSQQSHIRLAPEHYERAVAALASVAA